jgi:hypothetical protein
MYLIAFPLLLIPFALYNMVAFLLDLSFDDTLLELPLLAQRTMPVTTGDALMILGVLLLYLEILKVSRLNRKLITDHILSLILFGGMIYELLAVPKAATATFLVLLALSFVDVIGGFSFVSRAAPRIAEPEAADHFPAEG